MRHIVLLLALAFIGCGSGLPSASDQAAVGVYGATLQGCIAQAKLLDGGLPMYQVCAAKVDATFGLKDGGQ